MLAILHLLVMFVGDIFKSRRRLEAANLFLRHQLNIALRRAPPHPRPHGSNRALLVWTTRICPTLLAVSQVVKPETVLRWHRSGFKAFWRWKSRNRAGRDLRAKATASFSQGGPRRVGKEVKLTETLRFWTAACAVDAVRRAADVTEMTSSPGFTRGFLSRRRTGQRHRRRCRKGSIHPRTSAANSSWGRTPSCGVLW